MRFAVVISLMLGLAGLGWGWNAQRATPGIDLRRLGLLEDENARLRVLVETAEQERGERREAQLLENIEAEVAELRGLPFLTPVEYRVLTREELIPLIENKIAEQYSDEDLDRLGRAYAAMGMVPEGFDLRATYLALLGEQIAAFYDQHENALYTFENTPLRKGVNRIIMAHELTHALQDQHFFLETFPLETKTNDDLALATSALIEGDATLVMSEYMTRAESGITVGDIVGSMFAQGTEQLMAAPAFLRESLLFPYVQGQAFALTLFAQGGYASIDAAFEHPPASTSQILHPEKYLADPGAKPPEVRWHGLSETGMELLAENTLGEFGWRTLLAEWIPQPRARQSATGWRGDRYLVAETDAGLASAAWTVWETAEAADRFAAAAADMLAARYGAEAPRALSVLRPSPLEVAYYDAPDDAALSKLESVHGRITEVGEPILAEGLTP